MRLLIYCAHPAQFHFYKNIIIRLNSKGHIVKLLIKSKDILETLVKEDGLEYKNILPEPRGNSALSLFYSLIKREVRILKAALKFKPDLLIGSDASVTHVGWLLRKPRIIVGEDDYHIVKVHNWLMMPFVTAILAPTVCNLGPFEKKKIGFNGYLKSSYLHPDVFQPEYNIVKEAGLNEPFCLIRSVGLSAHHDKGMKGLNPAIILTLITKLISSGFHVYLDSEDELPPELIQYRSEIKKTMMHHIMAFAALVISDSQSMSVEASLLGVPSIRFNDFSGKISVLEELEHKYQLTFGIPSTEPDRLFEKVDELMAEKNLKEIFHERKNKMMKEKINTLDFVVWFLDRFPESLDNLKSKGGTFYPEIYLND